MSSSPFKIATCTCFSVNSLMSKTSPKASWMNLVRKLSSMVTTTKLFCVQKVGLERKQGNAKRALKPGKRGKQKSKMGKSKLSD